LWKFRYLYISDNFIPIGISRSWPSALDVVLMENGPVVASLLSGTPDNGRIVLRTIAPPLPSRFS
jgi:hypothetical protein